MTTRTLKKLVSNQASECYTDNASLNDAKIKISADTITSWSAWELLLPLLRKEVFSQATRVAIFRDTDSQGLAVYTNNLNSPYVYVEDALIGYDGSGPYLTSKILQSMNIDEVVFRLINEQHRGETFYNCTLQLYPEGVVID